MLVVDSTLDGRLSLLHGVDELIPGVNTYIIVLCSNSELK